MHRTLATALPLCFFGIVSGQPASAQEGSWSRTGLTQDGQIIASLLAPGAPRLISDDGRFVVFSTGEDFLPEDTNQTTDVFLRDRVTGEVELISTGPLGQGNASSTRPAISADGRFVVFTSLATNLVDPPLSADGYTEVFLRDRLLGTTEHISVSDSGQDVAASADYANLSADGQRVVFQSLSSDLVAGDTNFSTDVFLRDRSADTLTRLSISSSGEEGDSHSYSALISSDGSTVAFLSLATNYDVRDGNGEIDAYLHRISTGETELVSVTNGGNIGNRPVRDVSLSADGGLVAFSTGSRMVPSDVDNDDDVYVRDMAQGILERVSVTPDSSIQPDGRSYSALISPDGRYIVFVSAATNLGGSDSPTNDVYLRDLQEGTTTWISQTSDGSQAGFAVFPYSVGFQARTVEVFSLTSMTPDASQSGFFLLDRDGCTPTAATYCQASSTSIPGCEPQLRAEGEPSLAAAQQFELVLEDIPGAQFAVGYFGTQGPADTPFGTQGGRLCAAPPLQRTQPQIGTGTNGSTCDGQVRFSLDALNLVSGSGLMPGQVVHFAGWFRDPASADGFGLSGGLWFSVCP